MSRQASSIARRRTHADYGFISHHLLILMDNKAARWARVRGSVEMSFSFGDNLRILGRADLGR